MSLKADIARKKTALLVVEDLKANKIPNIKQAMIKSGYKESYANTKGVKVVRNSMEYKEVMNDFNSQMEVIIQNSTKNAIKQQKLNKPTFRDNIEAITQLEKLRMLKTGVPTDNVLVVNWSNKPDV